MKKIITVYDRYIFTQVLMTTLVAILLFTIVWIAPEMLLNTIKKVLNGTYTIQTGILVLIYEIPQILGKAFPVGLLLGSLFTFDKLSKDSELTIFRAVGMSFSRILRPLLVLSLIVTGLCFVTYDKLIPYSCQKLQEIKGSRTLTQYIYTQKDDKNRPLNAV
ncbi:LptF/LptG family permease, partial [bacterium]|nr:LptF/LptG family permease [bacterium]